MRRMPGERGHSQVCGGVSVCVFVYVDVYLYMCGGGGGGEEDARGEGAFPGMWGCWCVSVWCLYMCMYM